MPDLVFSVGIKEMNSQPALRLAFICATIATVATPMSAQVIGVPNDSLRHGLAVQLAVLLNGDAAQDVIAAVQPVGQLDTPQSRATVAVVAAYVAKFLPRDSVIAVAARQYEAAFAATELRTLVDFFRSPIGVRYLAERPAIQAKAKQDVTAILAPHQQELQRALIAALTGASPE